MPRAEVTAPVRRGSAILRAAVRDFDLAILGCGHMGLAVLRGALSKGVLRAERVLAVDPSAEARSSAAALGVQVHDDATAARAAERLLLAVKPQSFDALARQLAPLTEPVEVISIMSGWTRERIGASLRLKDGARRVVRAMPNLPATIGAGVTAIAAPSAAQDGDDFAASLFRAVGAVVFVDESMIDAVTALSGSGPAYLFLLAESMLDAARRLGFDEPAARTLVMSTLDGATALLRNDPRDPAELRAAVTSRGGTTEAATRVWIERGVPDSIAAAILAAALRAGELGRGSAQ